MMSQVRTVLADVRGLLVAAALLTACGAQDDEQAESYDFPELAEIGSLVPYGAIGEYYEANGGAARYGAPTTPEKDAAGSRCSGLRRHALRAQEFSTGYTLCWSPEDGVWTKRPLQGTEETVPPEKWVWWNVGCYCNGYDQIAGVQSINQIAEGRVCVEATSDPTGPFRSDCNDICRLNQAASGGSNAPCGVFTNTAVACNPHARPARWYLGSAPTCRVK